MARIRFILAALLVVPAMALAACGGDDTADVRELLNKAFNEEIRSARVALDVNVELKGVQQLKDPIRLTLTGPYQSAGEGKLPKVDWDLAVKLAGQSFTAGFVSTSDNAFVNFQGTDYEVGKQSVAQINKQLADAGKEGDKKGLAQFGVNPRNWVVNAKDEGEEEVAGASTTHVSATLDVGRFLDDVNKLVAQAGSIPGGQQARQLTDAEKKQVKDVVKNPRFDLYVGKDDNVIRRLSADLTFDVPAERRPQLNGLTGGSIRFSIEFRDVRKPQTVSPPANARPIAELTSRLGGIAGAPPAASGQGTPAQPQAPEGSGSGSGGGETPGPAANNEAFQAYSECLQKASPNDPAEVDKCADLLR